MALESVFDVFEKKFGAQPIERYHRRLRAIAYFDDAEKQPMPDMLLPCDWSTIRSFFAQEAARLLESGLTDS